MHFYKMFNYLQFSTKYKINTAPFGRKEIMGDNTDDGCCYIFTKYRQRIRTLGSKGDNTDDGAAATTKYRRRIYNAYHVVLSDFMEMKYA